MKIIGSAAETIQTYLHAGYISAYPRTYEFYDYAEPTLQLDVAQALQLNGETLASASTNFGHSWLASLTSTGDLAVMIGGSAAFFGALGLASMTESPRKAIAAMAAAALLGTAAGACKTAQEETEPLDAPWEGVEIQEYQNPEDATKALLYGVIADGLANTDRTVYSLADIQYEVAFPTKNPSEGMEYATTTYGIDGWGKEFKLESHGAPDTGEEIYDSWTVTSAGADGTFGNDD
ncbi:MAG: hypothetical protein HN348_25720, partial [Proteobacteria bacterium]|nr:hypothetical protein [Pseudomonadota bacterium]